MAEMRPEETLDIVTVDRIAEVLQIRDADRPDAQRAEVLADLHVIRNMLAHYSYDADHSAAAQEMTARCAELLGKLAALEKTSLGAPGAQRMRNRARADRVAHVLDLHESGPVAASGLPEFGELESVIMDVMWAADRPYLVREVRERLSYNRPVAYTTVMTVMNILYGKGVLRREKHGRAWRYWPVESREEHDARLMAEVLRSGGNQAVTMLRFVEQASDEEKENLRSAVLAEVLADLHVIRNMLAHYRYDGADHSAAAQEMTVRAAELLEQLAALEKTSLAASGARRMPFRAHADRAAPGLREFGELESVIMDVMWAADRPYLVREVRERLSYNRPVAYTTVMTVMNILYGKGVLRREKHGRAWRYWPVESREEHDARLMAEVLRSGGNQAVTMLRFVEQASDEEKESLRSAVLPGEQRAPAG